MESGFPLRLRDNRLKYLGLALVLALSVCALARAEEKDKQQAPGTPAPLRIEDLAPPEEFVEAGGIKTHFVQKGTCGPAIVLIHGFGSNTTTWRETLDGLGDRFRVYALDLKGFGLTEKPKDGQYNAPAYTRHLLAFLDAMKLQRPILVGNSMGGAVALRLALQHPDRVSGLVLVDAALPRLNGWDRPGVQAALLEGDDRRAKADDNAWLFRGLKVSPLLLRAAFSRRMVERGLRTSFHDESLVTPEMIDTYYRCFQTEGAMEALAAMLDPPPDREDLPPMDSLNIPVLVVWGRHDRVIPLSVADVFTDEIPGARKVIFEQSGHLPQEEEPDAFHALIAEFAGGIE